VRAILFALTISSLLSAGSLSFQNLSPRNGLSDIFVSDIVQDPNGFIWLATHDGLNRFDGQNIRTFRHEPGDSSAIAGSWINRLLCDKEGRIYCQLGIGGLAVYHPEDQRFSWLNSSNGLSSNLIQDMQIDDQGRVWLATPAGLDMIPPGSDTPLSITSADAYRVAFDGSGGVWLALKNGGIMRLYRQPDGQFSQQLFAEFEARISMMLSHDKTVWVATQNGQIMVFRVEKGDAYYETIYTIADRAPVVRMALHENTLFALTTNGLARIEENIIPGKTGYIWQPDNQPKRLSSMRLMESTGQIWITANGAAHFYRFDLATSAVQKDAFTSPAREIYHTRLFKDDRGGIWIASEHEGAFYHTPYKNGFTKVIGAENNITATETAGKNIYAAVGEKLAILRDEKIIWYEDTGAGHISALHYDENNGLWLGMADGSLGLWDTLAHRMVFKKRITKNAPIRCITAEDADHLWIGTDNNGLVLYNHQTGDRRLWHNGSSSQSLSSPFVWSLLNEEKYLWIGLAAGGLNRLDKNSGRVERFLPGQPPHHLNNLTVSVMHKDSAGYLWLGTYSGGLNRYDPVTGHFKALTEKDGLSGNMIKGILEAEGGHLWISTNGGVTRLNTADLSMTHFDRNDGLQAAALLTRAVALRDHAGRLYFGGQHGLDRIDPDELRNNPLPPRTVIERMRVVNNPDGAAPRMAPFSGRRELQLAYDQNVLEFSFVAPDYSHPAKITYAYKLDGVDKEWQHTRERRSAVYSNLSPGRYIFQVRAASNDGLWNPQPARLFLTITPPFWQTGWFYALAFSVALLIVVLAYRRHLSHKTRQAVERERIRVQEQARVRSKTAHDFHDELGHRLTRIAFLCRQMDLMPSFSEAELRKMISQIQDNTNQLYMGARDFIWAIDPRNDSFYEMAIRMKDFGDELFDGSPVHFQVDGFNQRMQRLFLDMDRRRHIPLIFKEAMNNIFKYAGAARVSLRFACSGNEFSITLRDDGNGFDPHNVRRGIGLESMRMRAEKSDVLLKIHSEPGAGTEITCTAKITQEGGLRRALVSRIHKQVTNKKGTEVHER